MAGFDQEVATLSKCNAQHISNLPNVCKTKELRGADKTQLCPLTIWVLISASLAKPSG